MQLPSMLFTVLCLCHGYSLMRCLWESPFSSVYNVSAAPPTSNFCVNLTTMIMTINIHSLKMQSFVNRLTCTPAILSLLYPSLLELRIFRTSYRHCGVVGAF